jgi:prevent-host-death family protein
METFKTVGIKELKNNLSAYLKEVKRGVRILVTDRDQVVAELREPLVSHPAEDKNPVYSRWVREGILRPSLEPNKGPYPRLGFKLPDLDVQKELDEMRSEEGRLP